MRRSSDKKSQRRGVRLMRRRSKRRGGNYTYTIQTDTSEKDNGSFNCSKVKSLLELKEQLQGKHPQMNLRGKRVIIHSEGIPEEEGSSSAARAGKVTTVFQKMRYNRSRARESKSMQNDMKELVKLQEARSSAERVVAKANTESVQIKTETQHDTAIDVRTPHKQLTELTAILKPEEEALKHEQQVYQMRNSNIQSRLKEIKQVLSKIDEYKKSLPKNESILISITSSSKELQLTTLVLEPYTLSYGTQDANLKPKLHFSDDSIVKIQPKEGIQKYHIYPYTLTTEQRDALERYTKIPSNANIQIATELLRFVDECDNTNHPLWAVVRPNPYTITNLEGSGLFAGLFFEQRIIYDYLTHMNIMDFNRNLSIYKKVEEWMNALQLTDFDKTVIYIIRGPEMTDSEWLDVGNWLKFSLDCNGTASTNKRIWRYMEGTEGTKGTEDTEIITMMFFDPYQ